MYHAILDNLQNPGELEKLYRNNKATFKREFSTIYPTLSGNLLADYWNTRLTYESDDISWGTKNDFIFIGITILLAGLTAKLPAFFSIDEEFFYPRNISFLVVPFLTAYFIWKNSVGKNTILFLAAFTGICVVYINALPFNINSDTLLLACIHLPLLLWVTMGIAYTGNELKTFQKRLQFLQFNGDVVVMSAMLGLAGGILTGITIGLFGLIGIKIEQFYAEYVIVFALPAIPIIATYLTHTNPQLVNRVSPVIARIFSPLVFIMLVIYLGAIIFSGKDPYNDREFLLLFNVLLIGVMALIFFSVAEGYHNAGKSSTGILLLLSLVTLVINGIALSAIAFRISEWGITPNRLAVLGGNVLILIHLLLVTIMLVKTYRKRAAISEVGKSIVLYIPVYFFWALLVVFLFPVLFGFR